MVLGSRAGFGPGTFTTAVVIFSRPAGASAAVAGGDLLFQGIEGLLGRHLDYPGGMGMPPEIIEEQTTINDLLGRKAARTS